MPSPRTDLINLWRSPDPFDYALADIRPAQLAAATEALEACRADIGLLDRRATDAGVDAIGSEQDAVPLLFSHSTYKSYPDAFVRRGRWDRMNAWLATMSRRPIDVDMDGVADIDGWIERLHAAGHYAMTTSGTSGRTSVLATSERDHAALRDGYFAGAAAMVGADAGDRTAFLAMPKGRTTVAQLTMELLAERLCAGTPRYLTETPLLAADLARMALLRRQMADGSADPGAVLEAETAGREREREIGERLAAFVDDVLDHRTEPLFVAGTFGMLWRVVQVAEQRGIPSGAFADGTVLLTGGGLKGVQAPPDVRERVRAFFGEQVGQFEAYGMSELNGPFARCAEGRYHVPPTTLLLVLDKPGETVLDSGGGTVVGRCAALDVWVDDRWGGVISGDQVTVSYDPCPCGRRSPQVMDVARYADLPEGDDKISCAASMDAYVRGEVEAAA